MLVDRSMIGVLAAALVAVTPVTGASQGGDA